MNFPGIPSERINQGQPILSPTANSWESGSTCNAAAVYLERSVQNDPIIRGLVGDNDIDDLPNGVVAVHYRAIPAKASGLAISLSSIGLAIFTPALQLLRRFDEPVLSPDPEPDSFDYLGVEDPRITQLGDTFYMVYCGPCLDVVRPYRTRLCLATSKDLIHWEKHGPVPGSPDAWDNKDGVLFPQPIDDQYYLLHRPWGGGFMISDYSIWLAGSPSPFGPWEDYGSIMHSYADPACTESWLGGGSVPIPLGEKRFLVIYHTARFRTSTHREYAVGAALFDFDRFSPQNSAGVVVSRLEPLMVPETEYEKSVSPEGRLDVLFPCGSYEFQGQIYLIYGASDIYVAAARINRQALLHALTSAS